MNEPMEPWARLRKSESTNIFPSASRSQDQYVAAINMTIQARKEARNWKKLTSFWRNIVRGKPSAPALSESVNFIVTPSPSDLSDTDQPLTDVRKQKVEALMDRLKIQVEVRLKKPEEKARQDKRIPDCSEQLARVPQSTPTLSSGLSPSNTSARTLVGEDDDDVFLGALYPNTPSPSFKRNVSSLAGGSPTGSKDQTLPGIPASRSCPTRAPSPLRQVISASASYTERGPISGLPLRTPLKLQVDGCGTNGTSLATRKDQRTPGLGILKASGQPLLNSLPANSSTKHVLFNDLPESSSPLAHVSTRQRDVKQRHATSPDFCSKAEESIHNSTKIPRAIPRRNLKPLQVVTGVRTTTGAQNKWNRASPNRG